MAATSIHGLAREQNPRTLAGTVIDDARTFNARSCPPFRAASWSLAGYPTEQDRRRMDTSSEQPVPTEGFHADARDGGHLYMQTNEIRNAIIHYLRSTSGTITEVERIPTGGPGSGVFRPLYQANGPNAFEGAGSVILTPDRRFLFATNGGDNSVSSFRVGEDGLQPS